MRLTLSYRLLVLVGLVVLPACQQKMAHQPYYRPYEEANEIFSDKRSARPLEVGVVARGSNPEWHPLMTGLSEKGRQLPPPPKGDGAEATLTPMSGAPSDPDNFVSNFPFPITEKDLKIGMDKYGAYCAMCHGPLGNGRGKIVERGYLKPTSYHTHKIDPKEPDETDDLPYGHSRGFWRWQKKIALKDVPVGYIYEVITKGYGGMPEHGSQVVPADRWRIVAYVRALQLSQSVKLSDLPPEEQAAASKALEGK